MTVKISKPAINLREELASLRNQGGLPKEDKLYLDDLVTNGDFSNGTTGWTLSSNEAPTWDANGYLQFNSSGAYFSTASQAVSTVVGKSYTVSFKMVANPAALQLKVGTTNGGFDLVSTSVDSLGTHSFTFIATTTTSYIYFSDGGSGANQQIDNVSVQEVGENLVTNGTFDTDSGWTKGTGWTISGGTASCDGSQTGTTNLDDVRTAPLNASVVTIQFTLSGNTAGAIQPRITGGSTVSGSYVSGNGVKTVTLADTGNNLRIRFTATSDFIGSIDNVILTEGNHNIIQSIPHGYDVKDVYIDGELAREGEAYDYEVKTDGINQWLKPTIEPTATTETAVIGVRK